MGVISFVQHVRPVDPALLIHVVRRGRPVLGGLKRPQQTREEETVPSVGTLLWYTAARPRWSEVA
jgi:hypothetical protein